MCSQKWPDLLGRDASAVMFAAVTAVAERSFFSVVEACEPARFSAMAAEIPRWMVAAVKFTEDDCVGSVSCTMPEELAQALFDAFTGREPLAPAPPADEILDLVGEFANIVCGSWLTRLAKNQTFTLHKPSVQPAPDPSQLSAPGARLLIAINDLPLVVEVRVAATVSAGA